MSYHSIFMRTASALAVTSVVGVAAYAAAPEAGAVIGNQAVATYQNAAGDTITVTSNTVETVVQQVAGVTLTADNTETIAPGGKAFLPHIITNDGNGPDAFSLTAVEQGTGALDTSALVFYPDADMDGVADSATPITQTPTLGAGEQFGVVIEATVASTATDTDTILITAASVLTAAVASTNTDTLTISNDAIVELVKSMVADPGVNGIVDAGDTVTITLTYSSTGLAAANNYTVQDILDANLVYVPGSAQWSDSSGALDDDNGSTVVDATNGSGESMSWDYDDGQTVNFSISSVGSGRSGSVTFQTTISDAANAGIITNEATQNVDGTAFPPSNTASVTVDNQYQVAIADTAYNIDGSINPAIASATDDDAARDDVVTESTDVFQGGVIKQEFVLTNLSNSPDSLTVDVSNVDFPDGTTFRFVGSDGVTPVVGPLGPLAIGESTKVTLIAQLPSDLAPTATTNYTAALTTTSEGSGVTDTSTAEFDGAILAAAVDLENNVAGVEGDGAAPYNGGTVPWITNATDPGVPVTFEMLVENNGPVSDSYNLSLDQALPDGWSVEFQLADGTIVSNTGTIPAGQSQTINVIVTPSDLAPPGDTPVDIKVESSVSGQGDRIVNQVTVNEVYDVAIIDDQSVQASPGGIVDMLHTVTNNGNVTITQGAIQDTGLTDFAGAVFYDANNDGVLDASDPVVDNFNDIAGGLAPGASLSLIYRVQTPSTATTGVSEIGTITLDGTLNGTQTDRDTADNAISDTIVIVSGDMTLTKYQYIDADCNGTVGTFSKLRQDVNPGQCIRYKVEAENTGAATADSVIISDAAPGYTSVTNCGGTCSETVLPAGSTATITSSNVTSDHGSILPGGFASIEFTVQVDQ